MATTLKQCSTTTPRLILRRSDKHSRTRDTHKILSLVRLRYPLPSVYYQTKRGALSLGPPPQISTAQTSTPTPVYHRWRHHLYREGRNIDARTVSKIINVKIPPIVRGRSIIARIPSRGRREKTRPAGTPHTANKKQ